MLLDLSAAFDTVDHATLLRRLKSSYGIGGSVLEWFTSYLSGRIQSVCYRMSTSMQGPTSPGLCPAASLCSIRRSVSPAVLQSLVVSLLLSRLDYGNAMLAGLPGNQLDRLQSVMNATAWLVCSARKKEHITPLHRDLHWFPVRERIKLKLGVFVFRYLHSTAPAYMANELCRVADIDARRRLRSASTSALVSSSSRRSTTGDPAFFVAAPRVWNSVTASDTSGASGADWRHIFSLFHFTELCCPSFYFYC